MFAVSILGEHEPFHFPEKQELTVRLKDILEQQVDEKFYLSDKIQQRMAFSPNFRNDIHYLGNSNPSAKIEQRYVVFSDTGIVGALTATDYKHPKEILRVSPKVAHPFIAASRGRNPENPSSRKAGEHVEQRLEANKDGVSNTITSVQKDNYVVEPFLIGSTQKNAGITDGNTSTTLTSAMGCGGGHIPMHNLTPDCRIRKLTPKE